MIESPDTNLVSDTISILREKRTKLAAKVAKTAAALDAAQTELDETETAIRVLVKMGLAADEDIETPANANVTHGQEQILSVLSDAPERGLSPRAVLLALRAQGVALSADYVRTALWRLAKRGAIATANSNYWRLPGATSLGNEEAPIQKTPGAETPGVSFEDGRVAELEDPQKSEQRPFRKGENVGSSPTPPAPIANVQANQSWDLDDDDVPF